MPTSAETAAEIRRLMLELPMGDPGWDWVFDACKAMVSEGLCPTCGGRLSPGRTCHTPGTCAADGHFPLWSLDGTAMSMESARRVHEYGPPPLSGG